MGKFVIRCPQCAAGEHSQEVYLTVSSGLFAKRHVTCPNGHDIDVKTERMAMKICPKCGNNVVYDQKKGEHAQCPVCQTKLNTVENNVSTKQILCPQCGCEHTVAKNGDSIECAVCGCIIDIQKELARKEMREKNIVSLIKYEGDNSFLVWKHPIEDFKLGSQLIVHESQEALLFANGQALDLFGSGMYTLTTENIPMLSNLYKPASGKDTFHSEIYYINKTIHTGIKWGTQSRISFFDPVSGMHINVGVSGQLNLAVNNSKKLILKLVGTTDVLLHNHNVEDAKDDSKYVFQFIKSLIVTKVRTHFASVMKSNGWSILEIDAYLEMLADGIKEKINFELDEYGLYLPEFYILSISTPEDSENRAEREDYMRMKRQYGEKYLRVKEEEIKESEALAAQKRKLVEAQTEAQIQLIESQRKAESMRLEGLAEAEVQRAQGFTGKDKLQFEVQKTFAENIGSSSGNSGSVIGEFAGLGVGLGMLSGIGNQVGNYMQMNTQQQSASGNVMASDMADGTWNCTFCGATGQKGRFCNECGKQQVQLSFTWICSKCGTKNMGGNFCIECGNQKETLISNVWECLSCGATGQTGKFCNICGKARNSEKV